MIRRAVAADAAPFAALLRALNEEPGLAPERITPERVRRDLIEDPRAIVLVAEEAGEIVGLATAHPSYDSGHSRWGVFLNDLYVAPGSRRRGIARALVGAVAREARAAGCDHLWWNADAGDDLAFRFHRSLGAEEAEVTDFLLAGAAFDRLAA
ncbi:GNAT family N-acetyltransferase [Falsiroseomonas oryziterrae]|uniref:GNAT family N-acetyltransferase n=1 Tax=Falsiroseomonas oryziterrae TaxID=2911368 RepID=UPI001F41DEEE|nr:GNAT family N-acetyltransferase [Roseomonas sp. NPKOSM-4]